MSKQDAVNVEKELLEATGVKAKRGEDRQDLLANVCEAIADLSDDKWEALSVEAQDWYNDAADAMNAKKDIPDFPAAPEEEKAAAPSRRGSGKAAAKVVTKEEEAPATPEIGDTIRVTTKRDKVVEGTLVEVDGDVIVVDVDGEEQEFQKDRVKLVELVQEVEDGESEAGEPDGEYEPEVDDEVVVVTKRDKTIEGIVVEVDDDILVIESDGKEEEFQRSRLASVTLKVKEEKPARGRSSTKAAEPEAPARRGASKSEAKEEKPARTSAKANGGVSVGIRIRETIVDNMDAKQEEISKMLRKEGLDFKDNTLSLVYADVHKLLDMLKARKLLKA